jgi:hypothetical protein
MTKSGGLRQHLQQLGWLPVLTAPMWHSGRAARSGPATATQAAAH